MIRFSCPRCSHLYEVPDRNAGKKGLCTRCGQRLQVPSPPNKTVLAPLVEHIPDSPASHPSATDGELPPDVLHLSHADLGEKDDLPWAIPLPAERGSRPERSGGEGFVLFGGGFSPWGELSVLGGLFLLFVFFIGPDLFRADPSFGRIGYLDRLLGVLVALGLLGAGTALLIAGRDK